MSIDSGDYSENEPFRILNIAAYFLFTIGPLVGNAVLVQLSPISVDFGVNPTLVLIAIPSFMIPFAIFQLFSGAISDIRGRIPVIVLGLLMYMAGDLLIIISYSIELFAIGNFLAGLGFGFVNPVLIALLTDTVERHEIPKRMGFVGAIATLGVGLGPAIAGQLARFGWRVFYSVFLVLTLMGTLVIFFANRPKQPQTDGPSFGEIVNIFSEELKKPTVLLMMLSSFMVAETYSATLIWTSRALAETVDPAISGILLMLLAITGGAAGLQMQKLVDKFTTRNVLFSGLTTLFVGVILLFFSTGYSGVEYLTFVGISLLILGWTGGTVSPSIISYSQTVSPRHRGALAGLVTFSLFTGTATVPTLYGIIFEFGVASVYLAIMFASCILTLVLYSLTKAVASKV